MADTYDYITMKLDTTPFSSPKDITENIPTWIISFEVWERSCACSTLRKSTAEATRIARASKADACARHPATLLHTRGTRP